jgi:protein-S-isoprenylcysteine O-methyltransferase Ste14
MADDQDNPGIRVPPPSIYLLALLLGLLVNRRLRVPFLPRGVARVLGWPLVGGAMALAVWFARTMRGADTTLRTDKPASSLVQDGPRSATAATPATSP